MRTFLYYVVALLIGLSAPGCVGSSMIRAKGCVVKGGEPFRPGEGEALRIILVPLEVPTSGGYDAYAAEFHKEDGTFEVKGKDGQGLPPGKYRVSLQLMKKKKDLFRGRLSGPRSPFTCEVGSGAPEVVVDLGPDKGAG
jgi:hypothetical protein